MACVYFVLAMLTGGPNPASQEIHRDSLRRFGPYVHSDELMISRGLLVLLCDVSCVAHVRRSLHELDSWLSCLFWPIRALLPDKICNQKASSPWGWMENGDKSQHILMKVSAAIRGQLALQGKSQRVIQNRTGRWAMSCCPDHDDTQKPRNNQ